MSHIERHLSPDFPKQPNPFLRGINSIMQRFHLPLRWLTADDIQQQKMQAYQQGRQSAREIILNTVLDRVGHAVSQVYGYSNLLADDQTLSDQQRLLTAEIHEGATNLRAFLLQLAQADLDRTREHGGSTMLELPDIDPDKGN